MAKCSFGYPFNLATAMPTHHIQWQRKHSAKIREQKIANSEWKKVATSFVSLCANSHICTRKRMDKTFLRLNCVFLPQHSKHFLMTKWYVCVRACVCVCFCEVKFKSLLAKAEEKKCGEQHTTTKNWTKEMKKGRNNKLTFEQQSKRKVCSFPAAC